jgi:hypothetical protein
VQQINPPASVLSTSSLGVTILTLLANLSAGRFLAAESARDQLQELEELHSQTGSKR